MDGEITPGDGLNPEARQQQETCKTCPFYDATVSYNDHAMQRQVKGACRAKAPQSPNDTRYPRRVWPHVQPDDWCGEHPTRRYLGGGR